MTCPLLGEAYARLFHNWLFYGGEVLSNPIGGLSESDFTKGEILIESPHNLFLTASGYFGLIGGVALFSLYLDTFVKGVKVANKIRYTALSHYRKWVLVLLAANISVIGHGWFHNASVFMGEMRSWIWIGSLWGIVYFIRRQTGTAARNV